MSCWNAEAVADQKTRCTTISIIIAHIERLPGGTRQTESAGA